MKTIYVTLKVQVGKSKYDWNSDCDSELVFDVPDDIADMIEFGNLLEQLYKSSLEKYRNMPEEKSEGDE